MTTTKYDIGDQPTITAEIRDIDHVLANPTSVVVRFVAPDMTLLDGGDALNVAVGVWQWTFPQPLDQAGYWTVKFFATGSLVAAESISINVAKSTVD